MNLEEYFGDLEFYTSLAEDSIKKRLDNIGFKCEHSFIKDFMSAEWDDLEKVEDVYSKLKEDWLSDYKAWTEVAVCLNYIAWFHDILIQAGMDYSYDAEDLYTELYHRATIEFNRKYKGNDEALDYYYEQTNQEKSILRHFN